MNLVSFRYCFLCVKCKAEQHLKVESKTKKPYKGLVAGTALSSCVQSRVCFTLRSSKKLLNISSLFCSKLRCFSIKIFFNCHPSKQSRKHLISSKFSICHLESSSEAEKLRLLYRYCFYFTTSLWIFLHTISLTHKSLLLPKTVLQHFYRNTFGRKFLFFCPSLKQLLKRVLQSHVPHVQVSAHIAKDTAFIKQMQYITKLLHFPWRTVGSL